MHSKESRSIQRSQNSGGWGPGSGCASEREQPLCISGSLPPLRPRAPQGSGYVVGGLELIRELMAVAGPPAAPRHSPPPPPGPDRGPPASAPSTAIHHLDPWRALTAALAALTRLTKQFATSHLLDRLLARPPLKQASLPLHPHFPIPARGSYLLCPLPSTSHCPWC